tara:strand:+ start:118 stop:897 length:780 start_codon:yes stop_codon:yes gene_type:complete
MKKTWKYTESDQEYVCHLDFLNRMICMQTPYNNYNIMMVHWLNTTIHRMPLEIEAEVMRLILDYIDPLELSEDEERHYRFWSHLDYRTLPVQQKYLSLKPYSYWNDIYMELTPSGVRYVEMKHQDIQTVKSTQRLDHLFFQGADQPLPLESRRELKKTLVEALHPDANLTLTDGFPLFDYSKIPVQRYDCSDDNGMTGTFWNLESTHIFIGGWSRQGRDGGGHRISIEKAWQKLDGLSGSFEQYRAEITTILKNAIIEE